MEHKRPIEGHNIFVGIDEVESVPTRFDFVLVQHFLIPLLFCGVVLPVET